MIERDRYDANAISQLAEGKPFVEVSLGSHTMAPYLRTPYIFYEQKIAELIKPAFRVLELGAGTGLHTRALLKTGARVVASDISPNSLVLLKQRFEAVPGNLETWVADMESLPFETSSFDVVVSAGSLSYGDPQLVDIEIKRVLRPGGSLICVDSLNHNPVYRINRWLHHLRGNRSKSTLKNIPDLTRINALSSGFSSVSVDYFGAFSFLMPFLACFAGDKLAKVASDRIDKLVGVKRSAFKFVLIAQGLRFS